MNAKKIFTKKRLVFVALFVVFAFFAQRINFSPLIGADNQNFTLFQFFGPIAGAFLGSIFGVIAVLFAEAVNFFVVGKEATWINIFRLAPMLFAVYYFGSKKRNLNIIAPSAAIILFVLHPVGRQAWVYSLFWTVPIIARLLPSKYAYSVPLRSLGATLTAHSVGSALFIWSIPTDPGMWITLIPITAFERLMFALGIGISYVGFNAVLDKALNAFKIKVPGDVLRIEKRFTLKA
ncbi:hypothetical protein KY347_07150 [Candidatus Woesearchaeota archaeon]|nr:hypothetical protein [Candidatus Woesearchaeota archaeon]